MTQRKDVTKQILQKLDRQEKEEQALPLLLQFYRELLRTQSKAKKNTGIPQIGISSQALYKRLEEGIPAIGFADLEFNWPLLRDLFIKVIAVYAKYPQVFGEIPERFQNSQAKHFLTSKAIRAWFNGEQLPATLEADDLNPDLVRATIRDTLKPLLGSYAESLAHVVDQECWRRRYCPICGGRPDFSFLDKELGSRWLLCPRCDMEWVFQRLECPFCGCQEQGSLGYLTDEAELYRLYTCQSCGYYLKAIDLRRTDKDVLLPLERLLTIDMDKQAWEKGYKAE